MFVRKWVFKRADGGVSIYLGIVRTYSEGGKVHQERLCHLGTLDQLQETGQIDQLIEGLARFSRKKWVVADESPVTGKE